MNTPPAHDESFEVEFEHQCLKARTVAAMDKARRKVAVHVERTRMTRKIYLDELEKELTPTEDGQG